MSDFYVGRNSAGQLSCHELINHSLFFFWNFLQNLRNIFKSESNSSQLNLLMQLWQDIARNFSFYGYFEKIRFIDCLFISSRFSNRWQTQRTFNKFCYISVWTFHPDINIIWRKCCIHCQQYNYADTTGLLPRLCLPDTTLFLMTAPIKYGDNDFVQKFYLQVL